MSDYPRMSNCSGEATDTVKTVELLLVTIFAFVTAVIVVFDRLVHAPLGEDRSQ